MSESAGWRQASGGVADRGSVSGRGPRAKRSGRDSPEGAYRSGGLLPQARSDARQRAEQDAELPQARSDAQRSRAERGAAKQSRARRGEAEQGAR